MACARREHVEAGARTSRAARQRAVGGASAALAATASSSGPRRRATACTASGSSPSSRTTAAAGPVDREVGDGTARPRRGAQPRGAATAPSATAVVRSAGRRPPRAGRARQPARRPGRRAAAYAAWAPRRRALGRRGVRALTSASSSAQPAGRAPSESAAAHTRPPRTAAATRPVVCSRPRRNASRSATSRTVPPSPPPRCRRNGRAHRRGTARRRAAAAQRTSAPSEEEVALGHGQLGGRRRPRSARRRSARRRCRGRPRSRGSASFSGMSALRDATGRRHQPQVPRKRQPVGEPVVERGRRDEVTATSRRRLRRSAPNIGRGSTGCGRGIDALASPIAAQAIMPPLSTTSGRTPKNFGSHSTRSASLPDLHRADLVVDAVGDRGADRVLRDVAAGAGIVGGAVARAASRGAASSRARSATCAAPPRRHGPSPGSPSRSSRSRRGRAARPRRRSCSAGCGSRRRRGPRAPTG